MEIASAQKNKKSEVDAMKYNGGEKLFFIELQDLGLVEYLWKHRSLSNLGLHCPVYYPVEEAAKTKTSIKS